MSKTRVYLVGAGPGDRELITLKGLRILSEADVILYDHLIAPELLTCAKDSAEKICVGKRASRHTRPQEDINKLIIQHAQAGKTVARLKGGDCCLFARGGEEAQSCAEAGIHFEIVPGITSALAAGSYAGIPATHRDFTSDVAIVTGHRKKGDNRPIHIPKAGTIIFLMAVGNIEAVIDALRQAGYAGETKIAAVEHAACYDQRVIEGTLETFPDIIRDKPLRTPAVLIIGKVVELRKQLDWFSRKPVVLHLGTQPQRYARLGTIVHRPIIECTESPDSEPIAEIVRNPAAFDWLVFTSPNGVRFFFKKLYAAGLDARIFARAQFAVIGQTTGRKLLEYGIKADLSPAVESAKGLLEAFAPVPFADLSILLPGPEVRSDELPDGLTEKGAKITKLNVYQTIEKTIDDIDLDYVNQILFTSGSTVRAFVKQCPTLPAHIQALCLGEPTQKIAAEHNINANIIEK